MKGKQSPNQYWMQLIILGKRGLLQQHATESPAHYRWEQKIIMI